MQWQQRERRRCAILKTEALPTSDPSDLESFPIHFPFIPALMLSGTLRPCYGSETRQLMFHSSGSGTLQLMVPVLLRQVSTPPLLLTSVQP